jgi:hypothetical protein
MNPKTELSSVFGFIKKSAALRAGFSTLAFIVHVS